MNLRYKTVCTVTMLHDYYASGNCADFDIVPDAETVQAMRGQGMLFKNVGNKLIIAINCDADGKPFIQPDPALKLRFYLRLQNVYFDNFTNLDFRPGESRRFYFSNINQAAISSPLYITSLVAEYNSGTDYKAGSLAANGSNDVFEALKPNGPGDVHGLGEASFWRPKGQVQYVSNTDLLEIAPFIYNFSVAAPGTNFSINIFGLNPASGNYDLQVIDTISLNFSDPQSRLQLRLETLPAGKYRINVNGDNHFIYLDKELNALSSFGIIELFNHLPAASPFALFDAAGKPRAAAYVIRFLNRSVLWKYISRSADVSAIHDSSSQFSFAAESGHQFISDKPIPLSETPYTTLSLDSATMGNISPLANPAADRLCTLLRDGDTYYCAELHLNY